MLRIILRDGSVVERDLAQDEVTIGKGPQNDIILPDASVSSAHAVIRFEDGAYKLSDLGSRNGTSVNDARITEPRAIQRIHRSPEIRPLTQWVSAVALLNTLVPRLAWLEYEVPEQDLTIPLNRIPTRPRSGFIIAGVRPAQRADTGEAVTGVPTAIGGKPPSSA